MNDKKISSAVINRLPIYYRYLGDLLELGIIRISSKELSMRMKVTASQIRQDLNNFGGFGQQGYGYNVKYLHDEIGELLGLNERTDLVIVGAGNLGTVIANYDFTHLGFRPVKIFDINPDKIGKVINGIEVLPESQMIQYIKDNNIKAAALLVPKASAIALATELADSGIKAIINFALVDLDFGDDISVLNIHLDEAIMTLSYKFKHMNDK